MADLPKTIVITEEGPREGFQFEKRPIPTDRKIALIDALSLTGLTQIQVVSFVNPKLVPGMADAEDVVAGFKKYPGVTYVGLSLNDKGVSRALATGRLDIKGNITLTASEAFLKRNQNRTFEENIKAQHDVITMFKTHDVPIERAGVMAAFGCNFEGDIPISRVLSTIADINTIAAEHDIALKTLTLADTMAWATPQSIKRVVGAVQDKYPTLDIILHLHDTRGLGIANAYAGLEMGVRRYDAAVAGLGGCPFAGHKGAAGTVCTEDLVFMCEEMGIDTGIDLEKLIEAARLAEAVVGHPLPGSVMLGGSLRELRAKARKAA
jgi:hydroxymethylglutaryl-CoA lyase